MRRVRGVWRVRCRCRVCRRWRRRRWCPPCGRRWAGRLGIPPMPPRRCRRRRWRLSRRLRSHRSSRARCQHRERVQSKGIESSETDMKNQLLTALLLASVALAPGLALAADPAEKTVEAHALTDKAATLYDEGVVAFRKSKWAEARASFLAAWALKQHWQI